MGTQSLEFHLGRAGQCHDCAASLHAHLSRLPGVEGVLFDVANQRITVDVNAGAKPGEIEAQVTLAIQRQERNHDLPSHEAQPPRSLATAKRPDFVSEQQELRAVALTNRRRLRLVLFAGAAIMTIEVVAGIYAHSLVLLADAAHYFTDVLAILLAYIAVSWSMRPATPSKSFGYHRAEVVAAFLNALGLWVVSAYLLWEAFRRLSSPPDVEGATVMIVGGFTLLANLALARTLHQASGRNVNVRAAYIHLLSDAFGSAAALVAGAFVYFGGYTIADPIVTIFVTLLILAFTVRLTRQTLHILLEGTPRHIDPSRVIAMLRTVGSVRDVHDLHVWTLTSGVESLSVHVVLERPPADDRVAHEIQDRLRQDFGIGHVTVQVESPGCPCESPSHA